MGPFDLMGGPTHSGLGARNDLEIQGNFKDRQVPNLWKRHLLGVGELKGGPHLPVVLVVGNTVCLRAGMCHVVDLLPFVCFKASSVPRVAHGIHLMPCRRPLPAPKGTECWGRQVSGWGCCSSGAKTCLSKALTYQ